MQRPTLAVQLLGTGEYTPSRTVASTDFDERWGKSAGWTERHTGVRSRQFATEAESSSYMGAEAARAALRNAQLEAQQIDCVISACSIMEQAIPCSAVLIHRRLGLEQSRVAAFDINATCLSFLVALDLASCAIAAGRYRRVLIVASEIASVGLNWDDPHSAALFGDGAAAAVIGRCDGASALLAAQFETYSEGAELCQVRAGGTRLRPDNDAKNWHEGTKFEMNGRSTYRLAARLLPGFFERLLADGELASHDLTAIVPHQASGKALDHLQSALDIQADKLVTVLRTRGNQIAASIPTALHHAVTCGKLSRGDIVALIGSGAGVSFGGIVLRY